VQLQLEGITVKYGNAIAVEDVSLRVDKGSAVCLVGANGSGKSTILRAISGLVPLAGGRIGVDGARIDRLEPHEIVSRGVVHVPEGRKLFPYLPVINNLRLGATLRNDRDGIRRDLDQVFQYFPKLWERRNQKAGTLSGGEQQMVAIGRGLMAAPRLLILDEPSLGLAPAIVAGLIPVIRDINRRGVSVLLAEQNMSLALAVADRGYALQVGRVVLEAGIAEFRESDLVRKAYLGG
jgi:branched-chain amino acid transport system ATP-binding protein